MMAAIISNTALHPRRIPRPEPKWRHSSAARRISAAAATLAIAFLFGTGNASAGPSSHIAWTPETLALVRSGNSALIERPLAVRAATNFASGEKSCRVVRS